MCTLYVLFYFSNTNTPHQRNWFQIPLRIARCPSRANSGAPVPSPIEALLFRRLLMFVRPTPVPPTPHQVHLSHSSLIASNQPDNGGAPVLSLPFRPALTTVRPTPVPPTPYPVHHSRPSHPSYPSHPCKNYVSSSSHYYTIESSRSNPANPSDTIQIQQYPVIQRYSDTIQPK